VVVPPFWQGDPFPPVLHGVIVSQLAPVYPVWQLQLQSFASIVPAAVPPF